jgi:tetratricopeptide (TPR) repeat protein
MRSRTYVVGLAALAAVATALPALAQPSSTTGDYPVCTRAVTDAESDLAHQKYIAGKALYDNGNYEPAIGNFRDAYAKDCTKHELLVILSRAYELKGDLPEAIRSLKTYVQRVPNAPDRTTYEGRIKSMEQELAKRQQERPSPHPSASTGAPPPPPPPPNGTSTAPQPPPPGAEPQQGHTLLPWIVVTVGGAAILTGIILFAVAPPLPSNCTKDHNNCARVPATESDAELSTDQDKASSHVNLVTTGTVLTIAGAGVLAGGLLWHFIEPTSSGTGKVHVTPTVGHGFAGAGVGASF